MTTVLVTGSSGFIGINLCHRLAEEGYDVRGIDIAPPRFDHPDDVETSIADLTTSPKLPESDVIVHLAAHSQVQPVVKDPNLALENIAITKHVLEEADRMGASVINASSRDVYGPAIRPSEDDVTPDSPNGYAASKLSSEAIANSYKNTHDIPVTSVRLANVYGPMDTNQRVIPIFIALADDGEELSVYGEGKLLDFVHIQDICEGILAVIERTEVMNGETVNFGSGVGTSLPDVADKVANTVDACPGWTSYPDRTGDVTRYVSDISKTKALLDVEFSTSLEKGLSQAIEWYLEQPDLLADIRERL